MATSTIINFALCSLSHLQVSRLLLRTRLNLKKKKKLILLCHIFRCFILLGAWEHYNRLIYASPFSLRTLLYYFVDIYIMINIEMQCPDCPKTLNPKRLGELGTLNCLKIDESVIKELLISHFVSSCPISTSLPPRSSLCTNLPFARVHRDIVYYLNVTGRCTAPFFAHSCAELALSHHVVSGGDAPSQGNPECITHHQ